MKILYIYRYCILGGVCTQLANRLSYLKEQCETHFIFLNDLGGISAFDGYPFMNIMPDISKIANYIKRHRFDIVITIDTYEAYAAIVKADYKGPVVNEVHTTTKNIEYLHRIKGRKIDVFLAPSSYIVKRLRNEFGYLNTPCYVVPNCLDTKLFLPNKMNCVPENKIILWVGKLDEHKNWPFFLSIASSIAKQRTDCEFWMVGGETALDETVVNLLNMAGQYNILSRLRWIQRVEYIDMPKLYSTIAASGGMTISTSKNESFGMTVIESLACSCPTLAPSVGAIPEILNKELECCLYPFADEKLAVNKINHLLNDLHHRRFVTAMGESRVLQRYSIEKAGKDYFEILKSL